VKQMIILVSFDFKANMTSAKSLKTKFEK